MSTVVDIATATIPAVLTGAFGTYAGRQSKKAEVAKIAKQAEADQTAREWQEKIAREARQRDAETARDATINRLLEASVDVTVKSDEIEQRNRATAEAAKAVGAVQMLGDLELYGAAKGLVLAKTGPERTAARAKFIAEALRFKNATPADPS